MEFVVPVCTKVAGAAVCKLVKMIGKSKNQRVITAEMRSDVIFLKEELSQIQATMETCDDRARYGHIIPLQLRASIAALRRLAYDIEDCIDRFNHTNMASEDFATNIRVLKNRSIEIREQIRHYAGPIPLWFIGTAERLGLLIINFFPILSKILEWAFGAPVQLDCLLAYFCIFPRNHHVKTKPLIRRWLAEGLVQAEHLAVENFHSFIDSSYISSIQRSINGNVKRCQPTDETLQLISQISMSKNFILVCDGTPQLQEEEARRLSVHPPANGQLILPPVLSHCRTLAVFPPSGATSLASYEDVFHFERYEVLRVLDLKECAGLEERHLKDILIKHPQVLLKYLSINLGSIDLIGREIRHLNQLETLDLSGSGTRTVTVSKEVLLLPELKHLLGKFQLSLTNTPSVPVLRLSVSDLEKFLKDKSKLETLAGFVTDRRLGFPQLMSLVKGLRKVKIWCKPKASEANLKVISEAIGKFSCDGARDLHGRSLTIDLQKGCSSEFLNTDASAGGRLGSLKLRGYLFDFPKFVEKLSVVQELCLCSTGLSWGVIQKGLSTVTGLKYLKLIEDNLGESLPTQVQPALPDLVSLHIICQNLDVSPGTPGIEISHMKNLKEVALHPHVHTAVSTQWQHAVDHHPNETVPVLLFIQAP